MENYFYYLIQEFEYMNSFELDPANYLYTPVCGCNKKVYLCFISDIEKYQFIASIIRGGEREGGISRFLKVILRLTIISKIE